MKVEIINANVCEGFESVTTGIVPKGHTLSLTVISDEVSVEVRNERGGFVSGFMIPIGYNRLVIRNQND